MIKHRIQCGPELIRIQSTSSLVLVKHKSQREKKEKVSKEKVSYHCGTKARGHYRFEICFCQPSLSYPKTSFALFSEVMLAQAAVTDTVKQLFNVKPFKDEPLNPRLAPRFTCFSGSKGFEEEDQRWRSRQHSFSTFPQICWRISPHLLL